jgi:hypothetical protein
MRFFLFFPSIWTTLIFKYHNFLIFLFILNDLKCYRSTTETFTNHLHTLITPAKHTRNFFECLGFGFVTFSGLFFWSSWPPQLWAAVTFSILIFLGTIDSAPDVPIRRRVQVLFGRQKQQSPPFGSSLLWALKCSIT